jgi:hypothetical protein
VTEIGSGADNESGFASEHSADRFGRDCGSIGTADNIYAGGPHDCG